MSSNSNKLYRNFIILQEDERGYANSQDKTLSGYSKIEAKGDKCRISFYAQNLRSDTEKYYMMLICGKKDRKEIIDLGPIAISEAGKGEATKEFYSTNIGGLDIPFEKLSGAAIVRLKDNVPIYIMYGFLNGEQPTDNWKNYKIVKAMEFKERPVEKDEKKEDKKEPKQKRDEKESRINKVEAKEADTSEVEEVSRKEIKESIRGKFEDYENQIESNKEFNPEEDSLRGSIGEYFEAIADGFESFRGGYKEIKYTKWYNVAVNELSEMTNMSNYNRYTLAYYPMLNYYPYIRKYGYFRLGYKCDLEGNLKYLVYGVPGKKDREEQPYDGKTGFVTWVRGEESEDLGCWLMFYDFKNATVVVPMEG